MNRFPNLKLFTRLPRRILLPLEPVPGRSQADPFFKEAKPEGKVVVYWQHDEINNSGHSIPRWERAIVPFQDRLPYDLWGAGASVWEFGRDGEEPKRLVDATPEAYLDLSLSIAGGDECALMIAWNPVPEDNRPEVSHLLITGRNLLDDPPLQGPEGERVLVLYAPRLALVPLGRIGKTDGRLPNCPPGEAWLGKFRERLGDSQKWQFQPKQIMVGVDQTQPPGVKGCALALDFGTCASAVAYLPIHGGAGGNDPGEEPLRGLLPWTYGCVVPNFDQEKSPKQIDYDVVDYRKGTLIKGLYQVVPQYVRSHLPPVTTQSLASAHVASLIYMIPKSACENVSSKPTVAIGNEALDCLHRDLQQKETGVVEWGQYWFGAKSLVGGSVPSPWPICPEHPVECFLRELLDQTLYRLVSRSGGDLPLLPPVERISYSYPVAWTKDQRSHFRRHLAHAFQRSAIREWLPLQGVENLLREDQAMDEASAAFLGFIMERFRGLAGDELVAAFQPFDPRPVAVKEYPKKLQVLVFDCGEGTTDVVWLEIVDSGRPGDEEGDQSQEWAPVDSFVRQHFAMGRAGLEITRRIAERIKEHLRVANPQLPGDRFRTNLQDDGIKTTFHSRGQTKEQYRRGLNNLLFKVAEDLKLGLTNGSQPIPWDEIRKRTGVERILPCDLTREDLERFVREVFQVAADQIRRWCCDGPRLDLVVMSGRSSRLPGLETLIREAIPERCRPYDMDFAVPGSFVLSSVEEDRRSEETSKNVVCTGLALNLFNKLALNRVSIRCNPIDEQRRSRAIGVLATNVALRPLPAFDVDYPLLVKPDHEPIDPYRELPLRPIRSPQAAGFYLGINFAGKVDPDHPQVLVDPPQPLCRVNIQGGTPEAFAALRFFFAQRSATEIRLVRVELEKVRGGGVLRHEVSEKEPLFTSLGIGSLRISVEPYRFDSDFRNTGRIHIDAAKPIDENQ